MFQLKYQPCGDSLEITLDVRLLIKFFLWLFLMMQLFEMCDKKQMRFFSECRHITEYQWPNTWS